MDFDKQDFMLVGLMFKSGQQVLLQVGTLTYKTQEEDAERIVIDLKENERIVGVKSERNRFAEHFGL